MFRQVANRAMCKIIGQIQEAISKILCKNNIDMESVKFYNLINMITEN